MRRTTCHCGEESLMATSWTKRNLGRRFLTCNSKASRCGFFVWYDDRIGDRASNIIPGLLRRRNEVEEAMRAKEKENARLKLVLLISCVLLVLWILINRLLG